MMVRERGHEVLNVDKLTYAANPEALEEVARDPRHRLLRADICDRAAIAEAFAAFAPDAVVHLAAESHVDRSIDGPAAFIHTNVVGTYVMLGGGALAYWRGLPAAGAGPFRFVHVSTDEVYGSLGPDGPFTETTPYDPNSPYAASKAAADHLVRAWHQHLRPAGDRHQLLEQLRPLPVPREADPADDHQRAGGRAAAGLRRRARTCATGSTSRTTPALLAAVLTRGRVGEGYNIGGNASAEHRRRARDLRRCSTSMRPGRAGRASA